MEAEIRRPSRSLGLGIRNWRRALGADELGPVHMPVLWPQIPAPHGQAGGALDGDASLQRRLADAPRPLPEQLGLAADLGGQVGLPTPFHVHEF